MDLKKPELTGNQLKLIAVIAMTIDHMGMLLWPRVMIFRIIGRLAMPIFAFMIAEGCKYTRSKGKYLLRMASLGFVCQVVYYAALGSLYQCILVTFSLSIALIWLVENVQKQKTTASALLAFGGLAAVVFLCVALPGILKGTDFGVDYGLVGVLLPVLVYFGRPQDNYFVAGLILLCFQYGGVQWFALFSIPLMAMYNGQRGRGSVGKWFYVYYPAHLVVLHFLSRVV